MYECMLACMHACMHVCFSYIMSASRDTHAYLYDIQQLREVPLGCPCVGDHNNSRVTQLGWKASLPTANVAERSSQSPSIGLSWGNKLLAYNCIDKTHGAQDTSEVRPRERIFKLRL